MSTTIMFPKGICIDVTMGRSGFRGKELIGDSREMVAFDTIIGISLHAPERSWDIERGSIFRDSEDHRKSPERLGAIVAETSGTRISL
jgi:hypothetical protein